MRLLWFRLIVNIVRLLCVQEYVDVLMKTMRETESHAERQELMNSAVSGAFRLSHSQRVFREILERVDEHMTTLEQRLVADRHDLTVSKVVVGGDLAAANNRWLVPRAALVRCPD